MSSQSNDEFESDFSQQQQQPQQSFDSTTATSIPSYIYILSALFTSLIPISLFATHISHYHRLAIADNLVAYSIVTLLSTFILTLSFTQTKHHIFINTLRSSPSVAAPQASASAVKKQKKTAATAAAVDAPVDGLVIIGYESTALSVLLNNFLYLAVFITLHQYLLPSVISHSSSSALYSYVTGVVVAAGTTAVAAPMLTK